MTDTTQRASEQQASEKQATAAEAEADVGAESDAADAELNREIEAEVSELLKDEFGDSDDAFAKAFKKAGKEAPADAGADAGQQAAPQEQQPTEQQRQERAASASEPPPAQEQQAPQQPAEQPSAENLQVSAEQLHQAMESYRQMAIQNLASNIYQLSEEQVQAIDEDPAEFIKKNVPQVLARVHLESQLAAMAQMARLMPTVMRHVHDQQSTARTLEDKFFERWPQLKSHYDSVVNLGQFYRQVNPQASPEDFIETVGLQAALQLKLPVDGTTMPVQQGQRQQQPFEPVAARAGVAPSPKPTEPPNEFEQLALEEMQDLGIPVR